MRFGSRLALILGCVLLGAAVPLSIDSIDRGRPSVGALSIVMLVLLALPGAALLAMAERRRCWVVTIGVLAGVGAAIAFVPLIGSESSTRSLAVLWLLYVGLPVGFAVQLVTVLVAERGRAAGLPRSE